MYDAIIVGSRCARVPVAMLLSRTDKEEHRRQQRDRGKRLDERVDKLVSFNWRIDRTHSPTALTK